MSDHLILASASPRRVHLLGMLGLRFAVDVSAVAETLDGPQSPEEQARRLALEKARVVAQRHPQEPVLAADSLIAHSGRLLGKPRDAADAVAMLRSLRGRWHRAITGVALILPGGVELCRSETTRVLMRRYTDQEIAAYVASGDPMDKAAAYAIQNQHFHPVERLEVCYCNVMGLPLCVVRDLLRSAGINVPRAGIGLRSHACSDCRAAREL